MKGPLVELDQRAADRLNLRHEPGWQGHFTRADAPEARWRPGQRVNKARAEHGDRHIVGTKGTILGSVFVPELGAGYFVEWDPTPRVAIFVVEGKIEVDISKDQI